MRKLSRTRLDGEKMWKKRPLCLLGGNSDYVKPFFSVFWRLQKKTLKRRKKEACGGTKALSLWDSNSWHWEMHFAPLFSCVLLVWKLLMEFEKSDLWSLRKATTWKTVCHIHTSSRFYLLLDLTKRTRCATKNVCTKKKPKKVSQSKKKASIKKSLGLLSKTESLCRFLVAKNKSTAFASGTVQKT